MLQLPQKPNQNLFGTVDHIFKKKL